MACARLSDLPLKKDFLTFLWSWTYNSIWEMPSPNSEERNILISKTQSRVWMNRPCCFPRFTTLISSYFFWLSHFPHRSTLFMKPSIKASVRVCVQEKGVSLQLWETACMRTIETECVWETRTETERQERRKEKGRDMVPIVSRIRTEAAGHNVRVKCPGWDSRFLCPAGSPLMKAEAQCHLGSKPGLRPTGTFWNALTRLQHGRGSLVSKRFFHGITIRVMPRSWFGKAPIFLYGQEFPWWFGQ